MSQVTYRFTPPQPVGLDALVRLTAIMMDGDVRLVCDEVTASVIDAKHADLLTKESEHEG